MNTLDNKSTFIRKELAAEVLKLLFQDKLESDIDKLPIKLYPRYQTPFRCCIYRDRAIIKYRIMAIMGIGIEDEHDETIPLSFYAKRALERKKIEEPVLTVVDEACSSCMKAQYMVTNICRKCVARPCIVNCPKKAVRMTTRQAEIDHEKCINCGICQKVCPYKAIVKLHIPCEESCPVDAISKDEHGKESIDYSKCIYCGKCTRGCPFGAIMEKTHLIDVGKNIHAKKNVIAMIAPSIAGQFGTMEKTIGAIKKIGFSKVYEVAVGADITSKNEAEEMVKRSKANGMMGTSCCPAYTQAVKKHAKSFKPYVSHARTPMSYTAEIVAKENPDTIKVFIGPCIAKKFEGIYDGNVGYALTYEELSAFFTALEIDVNKCKEEHFDSISASKYGRGFPAFNGVTGAVKHYIGNRAEINTVLIDGLSKEGVAQMNSYGKKVLPNTLVEVMSCTGGCMCGPGVVANPKNAVTKLKKYLESSGE